MRRRNALVVGLLVALIVTGLVIAGCGGSDDEAKANLSAALDKIETSLAAFQQMGADSTVDDILAARDAVKPDWEAVVTAAKEVKGADAAAAEKAWTDVEAAFGKIPQGASLMEAAAVIMGPVQTLLGVEADLRALVPKDK